MGTIALFYNWGKFRKAKKRRKSTLVSIYKILKILVISVKFTWLSWPIFIAGGCLFHCVNIYSIGLANALKCVSPATQNIWIFKISIQV